jgi:hypothetical protein
VTVAEFQSTVTEASKRSFRVLESMPCSAKKVRSTESVMFPKTIRSVTHFALPAHLVRKTLRK